MPDPDETPAPSVLSVPPVPWWRSSTGLLVLGIVLVAVLTSVGSAVWLLLQPDDGPDAGGRPRPSATPLADVDLSSLPVARAPFCPALRASDVEDALGAPVTTTRHYDSGQPAALEPGLRDRSHEFACGYVAADGSTARAWVFAEPVTRAVAEKIARSSAAEQGCRALRGAPAYGTPTSATTCRSRTDPARREVTLRGLFGDAWLTCRLSVPGGATVRTTAARREVERRAERWCVRVATSTGAQD